MSYENQPGYGSALNPPTGGRSSAPTESVQDIGSRIASQQGGIQYEPAPGSSLSGGAAPERDTAQHPNFQTGQQGLSGGAGSNYGQAGGLGLGGSTGAGLAGGYTGVNNPDQSSRLPSHTTTGSTSYEHSTQNLSSGVPNAGSLHGTSGLGGAPGTGTGGATIGGGGLNSSTTGLGSASGVGTAGTGTGSGTTGLGAGSGTTATGSAGQPGVYQQTVDTVQKTAGPYVAQAQEAAAPYVNQAKEVAGPYVQKAQESAAPYVAQAQEVAGPYVAKAQELGAAAVENARPLLNQAAEVAAQAGQVGMEKATQAYNAAATELDARGINKDSTQQKLAEVGQVMKDYGAVGQQRAGEYLQQAVDQAKTIGQDGENKSILATIFGTVFLVWLAFGFSIGAVFALGVAGSIAAILSRYTRGHNTSSAANTTSAQPSSTRATQATQNVGAPGVETHYPRPSHPDNSINNKAI